MYIFLGLAMHQASSPSQYNSIYHYQQQNMLQLLWHLSLTLSYVPLAYFICRLLVYGLKNQSAEHNITFKTVSSHLCLAARSSLNQGWLRTSCIVGRSAHRNLRQKTDSALQWLVTALLPCKEIKMSGSVLHKGTYCKVLNTSIMSCYRIYLEIDMGFWELCWSWSYYSATLWLCLHVKVTTILVHLSNLNGLSSLVWYGSKCICKYYGDFTSNSDCKVF